MFGDDDFDPDEDFLNDTQELDSYEESCPKRFKKDENSSAASCSESISNFVQPINSNLNRDHLVPNANDFGGDKSNRRNLILERLNRCKNTYSDPSINQQVNKSNGNCENLNPGISRLAAEPKTRNQQTIERNTESFATSTHSSENKSRTEIIKDYDSSSSKLHRHNTRGKSPFKPSKLFNKPVNVVRQFPGPAGLLPILSGKIIPPVSLDSSCYNESNDGIDTDIVKKSSVISEYCSQNTTNSFTKGPWQSLMKDLGDDYLSGHEISIIKRMALNNSYENDEAPFLAGIVQRVDFSHLDPCIVLKDYTDTIEGTIHRDVLVEYPQLLDIGVVLFLQSVGILTVGKYLKKCHVIITLENVVNVYTEKSQILSKSEMEARLQNLNKLRRPDDSIVNRESGSSCFFNSKMGQRTNVDRVKEIQNMKSTLHPSNSKNTCTSKLEKIQVKVPAAAKKDCNSSKSSSVELKLAAFRSKEMLTPPTSEDLDLGTVREVHKRNEAKDESSFTSSLMSKEDDSDEEFFSQVDIESIFSRYDTPNDVN